MVKPNDLHAYFINNGSRKIHKWIHYLDIYETHFNRFRNKQPIVVEIGVKHGGSLEMWKNYFGEGANIIGVDIDPSCKKHEVIGARIYIGDQSDESLLQKIVDENGAPDIVIDDGSHVMNDMVTTFKYLYNRISRTGCYLVEDVHTCYLERFGGGLGREGTFIEHVKALIDELHASHARGQQEITDFTYSTESISIYDSVCVFERRPQGARQAIITQGLEQGMRERRRRAPDNV